MDAVKDAAHAQLAELRMKIDDNDLLHSLEVSLQLESEPFRHEPNIMYHFNNDGATKRGSSHRV